MDRTERELLYVRAYTNDRLAVREELLNATNDWDILDDLMQEAFTVAWRDLDNFDQDQSSMLTWIVNIAKQVGVDHLRKEDADKRRNEVLETYIEAEADEGGYVTPYYDRTDMSAEYAAECEHLDPYYEYEAEQSAEYAFAKLPGASRYPMRLRAEGYTNPEIAEMLGLSVSYVENLISRARKFLHDGENREVNTDNNLQGERDERPVERFATQADVERAQRERFLRRESAFLKRAVRHANPDATVAQWKELY